MYPPRSPNLAVPNVFLIGTSPKVPYLNPSPMKKLSTLHSFLCGVLALATSVAFAQTQPAAQSLPYSQDFGSLTHASSSYPAGWQGWQLATAAVGSSFRTTGPTGDRLLVGNSTASTTSGNVHNYNGKIGYLTTGSLDVAMALALNTTGNVNVEVEFDAMTIRNPYDGGSNTRINEMILQYRVGTVGAFTDLTGTEYQNNTTTQTTAVTTPQNSQNISITLPSDCDDEAVVQLRWVSRQISGSGARPSFAVDNVVAAGTPIGSPLIAGDPTALNLGNAAPGFSTTDEFDVNASNLSPASGNLTVTAPGGTDFLVSDDNFTWVSSFNIGYTGGTLAATTVYVRFAPAAVGAQGGNVAISGGGASTFNVSVSGTGIAPQIYWDLGTATPTYDQILNVTTSDLGRGNNNNTPGAPVLINSTSSSNTYPGSSGGNNAGAAAYIGGMNPSTSTYFQFTLTPTVGYGIALNSIEFGSRSTGTGPTEYSIRWSLDGYTTDLASGTLLANNTWLFGSNTGLNLVSPTGVAVTYRIYGHSGSGSAVAGVANWRIDDLDLRGVAIQPAAIYYSRATGNVNDAIWSDTPAGTAGPAIFTSNSSMVVQTGDDVTVNVSTNVDDLTLESGATLTVNTERLISVYGDNIALAGTVTGTTGEFELIGFDPTTLTLTGTIQMWNLTVANSAGVAVLGNLDIRGTLLLADGDFDATSATVRLRSVDAGTTGRLGPVGATADYLGDLTVQRRIPSGVTNWRLLGSNVEGRTINDWNDDFITAGFPGSNYPNFDDPVGSGILWPSVRWYDESVGGSNVNDGLVGATSINQVLTPGQGFAVWCGDALGGTAAFTIDVVGEPIIANTPLSLPMTWTDSGNPTADGWNLLSNPLPSPISYDELDLGADVSDGYYIYDPVSGSTAYWDPNTQTSTPTGALNGVIQSSQGFWLRAAGSDVSTTVDEQAKVEGNDGGLFGGNDQIATHPLVRLTMQGAGAWYDQAAILFADGTPGLDPNDALKLDFSHPSTPRIATRTSNGHDLIVNRFGAFTSDISIPLTVRAPVTGTYTISAGITGMQAMSCFVLEDLLEGLVTPLADGAMYTFSMEASADMVMDRFVLHASTPVPFTVTDALCAGSNSGMVELVLPEGGVDVTLSDGFGTPIQTAVNVAAGAFIFDELAGGNYIIAVGGNTACGQVSADITILEPFLIEAQVEGLEASCPNTADGVLSVDVLGGEGPYSFNWSNGSTEAAIMDLPGNYSLVITDVNGCTINVEGMEIISGDGPIAGFELDGAPVLTGEEVLFTNNATMADSYFWDFGDGNTSEDAEPTHVFALPGVYTVTMFAFGGDCEDSWSVDVTVQVSTGVAQSTSPVTNVWSDGAHFVVDHGFEGNLAVEVLDATGRLHVQKSIAAAPGRILLPASGLVSGIWFVRLTHQQQQKTFRVPLLR